MREIRRRRYAGVLLAAVVTMMAISPQMNAVAGLPDALVMRAGGTAVLEVSAPLQAELSQDGGQAIAKLEQAAGAPVSLIAGGESGTAEVVFRLMGVVPVKTVNVTVEPERRLVPGGRSLGVAVETQGVVVVGASDLGNTASPARLAGLKAGDVICAVNGNAVNGAEALSDQVANGESAVLEVLREGERMECEITPVQDPRDGVYRLGVWVRDSTAGVGTLTYYDPQNGRFGALGHAITDVDTGVLFPLGEGAVYENEVVDIRRGVEGEPGELTGNFFDQDIALGEIDSNTDFGVFGTAGAEITGASLYPDGLPIGTRDEIHTGAAQILTSLDGANIEAYDCEIEKLFRQDTPATRSMVVRITDEELLARTGGIVQGMSGSPIIQDGRIVGAVTHVFVSDPRTGYGIYIENMLDAAG